MASGSAAPNPSAKEIHSGKGLAYLSQLTKGRLPGESLKRPTSSLSLQEKILLQRHALAQAAANAGTCAETTNDMPDANGSTRERDSTRASIAAFGLELPNKASPKSYDRSMSSDFPQANPQDDASSNGEMAPCQSEVKSTPGPKAKTEVAQSDKTEQRHMQLSEGTIIQIGDQRFCICEALGTGSYGVVWCARRQRESEEHENEANYAVKEIWCKTQAELSNALFESNLLKRLGDGQEGNSLLMSRIPRMAAQDADNFGEVWRVRLAMSRLPGEPLALVLQNCKRQELHDVPAREAMRLLAEPCRITSELLTQLGPALQELSKTAFHRDVNPRNILVSKINVEGRTSFGLVDFGMAVDARRWIGSSKEDGGWKRLEVGGDCRYWPLSSWVMFMRGPQELEPGSPLRTEYQSALDLHALGITALQVLMEQSPLLPSKAAGPKDQTHTLCAFRALQDSWRRYWRDVSMFWESLMNCFATGGNWMTLKASCIESGLDRVLAGRLSELRSALEDLGLASARVNAANNELEVLSRTLLTLLSKAQFPDLWTKSPPKPKPSQEKQSSSYPSQRLQPQVLPQRPKTDQPRQHQQQRHQQLLKQEQQKQQMHPQQSQQPQPHCHFHLHENRSNAACGEGPLGPGFNEGCAGIRTARHSFAVESTISAQPLRRRSGSPHASRSAPLPIQRPSFDPARQSPEVACATSNGFVRSPPIAMMSGLWGGGAAVVPPK